MCFSSRQTLSNPTLLLRGGLDNLSSKGLLHYIRRVSGVGEQRSGMRSGPRA